MLLQITLLAAVFNCLVCAITTAIIASQRGYKPVSAFFGGFLFGPYALIVACATPTFEVGPARLCQFCRSYVPELASVCRFCTHELPDDEAEGIEQ